MAVSSPRFDFYRARAAQILASPARLHALLQGALRFVEGSRSLPAALGTVRADVQTGIDLVASWHRGEYEGVSRTSLVLLAGALLYLVTPLDLVPDFVPVSGLLDDAAVIAAVAGRLQRELEQFRAWRRDAARTPNDVD